jgi:hypothetical protein
MSNQTPTKISALCSLLIPFCRIVIKGPRITSTLRHIGLRTGSSGTRLLTRGFTILGQHGRPRIGQGSSWTEPLCGGPFSNPARFVVFHFIPELEVEMCILANVLYFYFSIPKETRRQLNERSTSGKIDSVSHVKCSTGKSHD